MSGNPPVPPPSHDDIEFQVELSEISQASSRSRKSDLDSTSRDAMSGDTSSSDVKSPGLRALQGAAEEVVINDSLEGVKAMAEAADQLAASGEVLGSSLNMSASSATIANALSSSADMGGKAVSISLPTQTPMKSPGADVPMSQTTPLTEGKLRENMVGQANAAIDAALAKSVTINEKENTAQSPSSSAYAGHVPAAGMPALKDAGASAHKFESRIKSPASPLQKSPARMVASPPKPKGGAQGSNQVTDQEKAKAKYLLARAYNRKSSDFPETDKRPQGDRYSSYSGSSGGSYRSQRSVETTESDIAKKLRRSQQRVRDSQDVGRSNGDIRGSRDRAMDAVFSSLSEQQQTLFLMMKSTGAQPKGRGRGATRRERSASPESKSVSSYDDTTSVRSSRSGTSSRPGSRGKGRPSSASSSTSSLRRSRAEIHEISDRLTAPVHIEPSAEEKSNDPTLKYLLLDEAKNCRSKPFKAKRWAGSNRADGDEAKSNFIERMELQEHHRREDMANKRAAADNDALLTRSKLTWSQVGKQFLARTSKNSMKSQAKREELVKTIEEMQQPKVQVFDPKKGKVVTEAAPKNKKKWTESTKADFFDRMDEHSVKAKKNLEKIEDESFGVQCTFMPKTGAKRDEEDEEDTGIHAFLRRLDEQGEEKKAKSPHLFTEKYQPDPLLEGKPTWKPT